EELKAELEDDAELGPRVRHYNVEWDGDAKKVQAKSLETWGRQVLDDIWDELDEETRAFESRPDPTWEEGERDELDTFVEHRARGFVGRWAITKTLIEH